MIAGFAAVDETGWGVLVPQLLNELETMIIERNWDALVVMSVGLVFSLMMAYVVSSRFSRRLNDFATAVQCVSELRDDVRVRGGVLLGSKSSKPLRQKSIGLPMTPTSRGARRRSITGIWKWRTANCGVKWRTG